MTAIRCLIGDDHEALRRGLADLLRREDDIDVVGDAGSADQILRLVESRRPDVVIVDVEMPDHSGIEFCDTLRSRGLDTATILYTAFEDPDLVEAGFAAGARGFLLKSSPPQTVAHAVRLVHTGQQYIDASLAPLVLQRRSENRALLSPRETDVLRLLAVGKTTDEAASALFLSPATVRSYVEGAMSKLGASNRVHAVAEALRLGLIE